MAYIVNGQVVKQRSPWRLSIITDTFWAIIAAVTLFFQLLIDPSAQTKYKARGASSSRGGGGGGGGPGGGPGGGGPPRRRIVGMDSLKDAATVPCGSGG